MNVNDLRKKTVELLSISALKEYGLDFLLYFTCCLPFLRILPIPSDVQPYALIVAVIYLIAHRRRLLIPEFHAVTFWVFAFAAVVAVADLIFDRTLSFMMLIRKTYNYAGLFLISLALVNSMVKTKGVKESWIKTFILVWLFVGVVQTLFNRQFMSFLVSNYRTTSTRGVAGLASEPSFYGYVMIFFFVLASGFKKGKRIYQGICLVQITLLAQSAVTFVYLAVFVMMCVVKEIVFFGRNTPEQKKKKLIIAGVSMAVIVAAVLIVMKTMAHTRLVSVFVKLFSNLGNIKSVKDLYAVDVSVAERVESIILAFQGFGQAWGLPNGFGQILINGVEYVRIMSGFGAVIYEVGLVGVALVAAVIWSLIRGLKNGFVFGISISIIMFSAIQLGSPIFILVFACALYARGHAKMASVNLEEWYNRLLTKLPRKKHE